MSADNESSVAVEVAYATPAQQAIVEVRLPRGSTIRTAVERSRIHEKFPEIDLAINRVGIHGVLKPLDTLVHNGDRVEIYRPLIVDPKEARRLNAEANKKRG